MYVVQQKAPPPVSAFPKLKVPRFILVSLYGVLLLVSCPKPVLGVLSSRYITRGKYDIRWYRNVLGGRLSRYSYELQARQQGFDSRQVQEIFSPPQCLHRLWGPPRPYPMGIGGSFPGGNAAGAWSWPLTSIQCRGEEWWSYTSHPLSTPIRLHSVETSLPLPSCNDGFGTETTQRRTVGLEMNRKGFERTRSWPNRDTIKAFLVARLRKTTKNPVMIACITAEIRTVHLPNTSVDQPVQFSFCYILISLPGYSPSNPPQLSIYYLLSLVVPNSLSSAANVCRAPDTDTHINTSSSAFDIFL
jgi:hypothetical protein